MRSVVGLLLSSVFLVRREYLVRFSNSIQLYSFLRSLQQLTGGSFHLKCQISQYRNPSGNQANGWCCEPLSFCFDSCDTEFEEICLGPGGSSEGCPWSEYVLSPGSVGGNNIQFTDTVGSVSNPFSFTVTQVGWFKRIVYKFRSKFVCYS